MPRRYVFFVNAAYCYSVFRPIQEIIWQRGEEVAWFFVRELQPSLNPNEQLLSNEEEVNAFAPSTMFGVSDWLPYYLPGLKVMLFHGMAINKRADKNDVHYKIRGWYDLYCTHAEKDTRIFSELASQHKNFYVKKTGWPKIDNLVNASTKHFNQQNKQQKTLFFASTFTPDITSAPYVADELKRISNLDSWQVIATLHPLMSKAVVDKFQSLQSKSFILLKPEEDLHQAMLQADVMLCDTSSIMYEFMFLNKPVVTFKTKNPGPFVTDVNQVDDILPALQTVINNPIKQLQAAQKVCHDLNELADGKASQRVIEAIDKVFSGELPPLKAKPLNIIRKLKLRKRLGYWKF